MNWPLRARTAASATGLLAILLVTLVLSHRRALEERAGWPAIETRVTVPPPRMARFLALGYNELAADVAWARTLVYYGGGMAKGHTLADVDPLLALVNALDPWFRRPYMWGAFATTFRQREATVEEYRASVALLERGVAVYPDDWELNWVLGLRYYLDLKADDPDEQRALKETGAAYIEKAMRCPGAPADLGLLASTMRTKLGQRERALAELREMILSTEDAPARAKLLKRYEDMTGEDTVAMQQADQDFRKAWKGDLPYVPPSMYSLIGTRTGPYVRTDGPSFTLGD